MDHPNKESDDDTYRKNNTVTGVPTKGILKSSQNSESLAPASQPPLMAVVVPANVQLPTHLLSRSDILDGNNTTSRINTLNLQNKGNRRVSFAPDVTLHSFDFIPEQQVNLREPRRKAQDTLVTSTQIDEVDKDAEPVGFASGIDETYKPVFDREVSMDITQLFSKHSVSPEAATTRDETMDFTNVQTSARTANEPEEKIRDETMEFTNIINHKGIERDDLVAAENGNTMEITSIHGAQDPTNAAISMQRTPNTKKSEDNSPAPNQSKRRKLNENKDYISPIKNTQNYDEMSNSGSEDQDMELSSMEKMSPIKLNGMKTLTGNLENEEDNVSYSLKEFIEQTGVSFLIDTDLIDKKNKSVIFPLVDRFQADKFRINQLYNALYLDTPILEMNAFICNELVRRISQSKKQFDDLERQVSTSIPPPLLFSEYFHSNKEMRELLNQQIQLVKSYAKLEAKNSWYEWRIQHLNGIQNVLMENLVLLKEEYEKVNQELLKARNTKIQAEKLRDSIRREIKLLKELPSDSYQKETNLIDKVKLETLRQVLVLNRTSLTNSQDLVKEYNSLQSEMCKKSHQLEELKKEIFLLRQINAKKGKYRDYDTFRLRKNLEILGIISGVEFVKFNGTELTIKTSSLNPPLEVSIDLAFTNGPLIQLIEPLHIDEFLKYYFDQIAQKLKSINSHDFLAHFLIEIRKAIPLIKEYNLLKLMFPIILLRNANGKCSSLTIKDFDLKSNSKVTYHLPLEDFVTAVLEKDSKISMTATVVNSENISIPMLSSRFFKRAAKIFPWINENRVNILFNEL